MFCFKGNPGNKNKGSNKRSNNKKGAKSKANKSKNVKKPNGPITGLCDLSQKLYNTMEKHREVSHCDSCSSFLASALAFCGSMCVFTFTLGFQGRGPRGAVLLLFPAEILMSLSFPV